MKPLWKGPYEEGITQSLLQTFIKCRHQFWLKVVAGWSKPRCFDYKRDYGSLMHEGHEAFCTTSDIKVISKKINSKRKEYLNDFPESSYEINYWSDIAIIQYKVYSKLFKEQDSGKDYIVHELPFDHPYELPDGRTVILRGKMDSGYKDEDGVILQENKTRGYLDINKTARNLPIDLQVMYYVIPFQDMFGKVDFCLYNLVKRPSDRLRQGKKETYKEFLNRLEDMMWNSYSDYFKRLRVRFIPEHFTTFQRQSLNPILTQLCDWWDSIFSLDNPFDSPYHWIRPLGIFEPEAVDMDGDYADLISNGNTIGYEKTDNLFPEL